jgi:hypothetical protein
MAYRKVIFAVSCGSRLPTFIVYRPRLDRFQHHGRIPGFDRVLVLPLRGLLLDDDAFEHAPADFNFELEKHRIEGQREPC